MVEYRKSPRYDAKYLFGKNYGEKGGLIGISLYQTAYSYPESVHSSLIAQRRRQISPPLNCRHSTLTRMGGFPFAHSENRRNAQERHSKTVLTLSGLQLRLEYPLRRLVKCAQ